MRGDRSVRHPRVPTHRLRGSHDASAERPALTVAPNARGAPDGVKRSLLSRSQEAHCSDEKWESPLLAHVCCQDGVDDAILSPRPGSHHQYAWRSLEVPRGASAGKVAVVGAKLCPERRRSNGTAVKLQEEPVFVSPQTEYSVPVWPQAPISAGGCVAPLHEGPISPSACRPCDCGKHYIGAKCVGEIGEQCPPRCRRSWDPGSGTLSVLTALART